MLRIAITGAVLALFMAACGGGEDTADSSASTSPAVSNPLALETGEDANAFATTLAGSVPLDLVPGARFVIAAADDGAVLRVHPGDSIRVRLHVDDPSGPLWIFDTDSDLAFLDIGDSLLWMPSEPGAEPNHFELVIWVIGAGEADIVFSLGPLDPAAATVAFTLQSTDE